MYRSYVISRTCLGLYYNTYTHRCTHTHSSNETTADHHAILYINYQMTGYVIFCPPSYLNGLTVMLPGTQCTCTCITSSYSGPLLIWSYLETW